jgi:hypothetical protein
MVVRLPYPLREGADLLDRRTLVHQTVETILAFPPPAPHLGLHRREAPAELGQPGPGEAACPVDAAIEPVLEHPRILQLDHGTSTVRPS